MLTGKNTYGNNLNKYYSTRNKPETLTLVLCPSTELEKKGDNNDKGLYRTCVTGKVVNNGPMYFTCGNVWEYIVTMRNREFKVCSKHIEDPE